MTVSSTPRVSVVVTCYNSALTVLRAIDSVREQTISDLEIVVVDDASSDSTVAVVEAIREPRIRLIRNNRNRGIGGAKNVGVAAARGRIIAFIDSDDSWVPEKLAIQLDALDRDPSHAPLSFSAFWVHRGGTGATVLRCPARRGSWLKSILSGETFSLGSTFVATKACFDAVGDFDERLARLQDRDWTLRYLRQHGEFVFVPQPLAHIYNSGWPEPGTVERSVNELYELHESSLRANDPALADLFRASLSFEVAIVEYRNGFPAAAARRLVGAFATYPPYAGYLASRFARKLRERDLA
jgi:glycosyltransferase involved in cell wall biosynthesis